MKADIVVVGGGVIGLASAYYLAKYGGENIVVVERQYIGSGASTRNASHFRVHFWSRENTIFAIKSRKLYKSLASESGWNPLIEYTGYLWLIYDDETLKAYEAMNKKLWSKLGVSVNFLSPKEVERKYPYINLDGVIAGVFGPQDGKFHHDFVVYGFYSLAVRHRVKVLEYTEAKKILVKNHEVLGVETDRGAIYARKILLANNFWATSLLDSIDIELPITPERKEICVTEPFKPFIDPLVVCMNPEFNGLYIGQTVRGEVMGSIDYPPSYGVSEPGNTLKWVAKFAKNAIKLIPALKYARFMRVWSGFYDMTPDNSHIMGRINDWPEGLYVAIGFSGHGFMLAPYIGELIAKAMLFNEVHNDMKPYLPDRFEKKKLIKETMVIG